MDLPDLDFPVLMLAAPAPAPFLSGCGGDGRLVSDVEVAYESDDADGPSLRLRTQARRGWRLVNGHALTTGADLPTLGAQAVTGALLDTIPPGRGLVFTQAATERILARGEALGSRIPGPPWVLRPLDVDGTSFASWLLELEDDRFCLVADCGPVVLTATGRHAAALPAALHAASSAEARPGLRPAP